MFCIITAFSLLIISRNTYEITGNGPFIFLGIAYGFVGGFISFHTVTYNGLGIFPGNTVDLSEHFRIASAYIQAISFFIFSLLLYREINIRLTLYPYHLVSILILLSIFYFNVFPSNFIDSQSSTYLKIASEYIVCIIQIISIILLYKKKSKFHNSVFMFLLLSLAAATISEAFFLLSYLQIPLNTWGHIFKFISFYFIYISILDTNLKKPYRMLSEVNNELYNKTTTLQSVNMKLEQEIMERKQAEEKIKYLSFHDKLTGLYNRAFFEEELMRLNTERQLPISVIMGDLNNLKLANDIFGHEEGDKLLVRIAEILKICCREEDIVARWGGDEFIILLPKTLEETASKICDRIKSACAEYQCSPIQPSIALGIASKINIEQKIEKVLNDAEDRMYRNKLVEHKSGRHSTIASLQRLLLEKDYEIQEHTVRLQALALKMGHALNLSNSQLDELSLLALLHDIGKIAISDEILLKPGNLSDEEWNTIKKHPEIGFRIAQSSSELSSIAYAVLTHHEHWDGSGYPQGLSGEKIPFISRIIAILDAYDIMTHGCIYKNKITSEAAAVEIKNHSGSQFDPILVEAFLYMQPQIHQNDQNYA